MEEIDHFYRAYETYKKEFEGDRDDYLFKKALKGHKNDDDFVSMIHTECEIQEDWVIAIERGLVFIAKAIKEDRQFIRNEGEILPIEKVRRIGKDSVVDLAKHTDYITKKPEHPTDNLIPEKLLIVKRENDYSIYENRVVYATLLYLKEFISSRLSRISDAVNRYQGKCFIKEKVDLGNRRVDFTMSLDENRNNDPIAIRNSHCQSLLFRINEALNDVVILLRTRLMQEVSKAPLVSRPITKTNVLKMNTNFKESLAVFDYVCEYPGDGFTITQKVVKIAPLPDEEHDEFADIISLSSFLAYQLNNQIRPELKERFLAEEKRRKEESDQAILDRLKALMGKAHDSGKSLDDYLLALEDGYRVLEEKVATAKQHLQETIDAYEKKMADLKEAHQQEITELNHKHEEVIDSIEATHDKEMAELKQAQADELSKLAAEKDQEKAALQAEMDQKVNELNATLAEKEGQIDVLKNQVQLSESASQEAKETSAREISAAKKDAEDQIVAAKAEALYEIKKANEEKELAQAELTSLRVASGKAPSPAEYTSRERFLELEEEKKTLDKFFEASWKETKRTIRKELFSQKPGQDNEPKGGSDK
jgi:hypothetical protein